MQRQRLVGAGSNGAGNGAIDHFVEDIVISGSDVYVGGRFTNAAGIATADRLARWNGAAWSALGSNGAGDGAFSARVSDMDISGSNL